MAKLLYQGHGSFRITTSQGVVAYIDPYAGEGYDLPADIILITHQHGDHNQSDQVAKKADCRIISNNMVKAEKGGRKYEKLNLCGIEIEAVEAANSNHNPDECVGYLLAFDGIKIYAAGDTSKTARMAAMKGEGLDYALLPCDGVYNMDTAEASECAELIGARHSIPIHMKPGALFDRETAERFTGPGRIIIEPGEEIEL